MPLDPSIAMSVQPLQVENPMNGLMNMLKIKQARAEISANEKALSDSNKLNALYSQAYSQQTGGNIDRDALYQSAAQQGMGEQIPSMQKTFADSDLAQAKADKENVELVDAKLKQSRGMLDTVQTPEQYLAWHEANHADPILGPMLAKRGITAESARKQIIQALQTPGGFEQQLQKSALGLEKFTTQFTQSANNIASNAVTMRGQNMADARARRGQDMMFNTPQYVETNEGLVALPKKLPYGQSPTSMPVMGADGQQLKKSSKQGPMSATLQKELIESDDQAQAGKAIISTLQNALKINKDAYSGYGAKTRAMLASNLIPGDTPGADTTIDLDNMMTGQALESLKTTFGGMPTEGERKILLDMQASADKTPAQRESIMKRAIEAADRRQKFAEKKASAIRSGEYLKGETGSAPPAPTGRSLDEIFGGGQ